jgi:starch phosphorylase
MEEHFGPLREALGLSHDAFMALGREQTGNSNEEFCMTVLGLRLSRRANAVSALHGEVSRAMWTGLYPGKLEDQVPVGHITNGVHVPSWLAPQMFRLYDRHLGIGWHEHSGESRIWEGIENVDDGELWETHLSLKARLLEFVRRRAMEQARRRNESRDQSVSAQPLKMWGRSSTCGPSMARLSLPKTYQPRGRSVARLSKGLRSSSGIRNSAITIS